MRDAKFPGTLSSSAGGAAVVDGAAILCWLDCDFVGEVTFGSTTPDSFSITILLFSCRDDEKLASVHVPLTSL